MTASPPRALPVRPGFGPTLPELVGRRTFAVLALLAVLGALAAVFVAAGGASGERSVVVAAPLALNLRHSDALSRVPPRGDEVLRLAGRGPEAFVVSPLRLPGPAVPAPESAVLPLVADRIAREELPRRFAAVEVVDEGRARINEAPGYELAFRARRGGERVYGRVVLLVPPETPGARTGARVDLLSPRTDAVPSALAVGEAGQLKLPLRSLRFGTDAP